MLGNKNGEILFSMICNHPLIRFCSSVRLSASLSSPYPFLLITLASPFTQTTKQGNRLERDVPVTEIFNFSLFCIAVLPSLNTCRMSSLMSETKQSSGNQASAFLRREWTDPWHPSLYFFSLVNSASADRCTLAHGTIQSIRPTPVVVHLIAAEGT